MMLIYTCTFLAAASVASALPSGHTKLNENQDVSQRIDENARLIETLYERLEHQSKLMQQLLNDNAKLNMEVGKLKAVQGKLIT